MEITKEEYAGMVSAASPKSKVIENCLKAFIAGGLICLMGQALNDTYTMAFGLDRRDAGSLTSMTLIMLAAILTGLGVYDNIAKYAGAGTLVPITGFSNAVAAPAIEFKSEGLVTGLGAKIFTIAGPVIVYGTVSSILYGLILQTIKVFS